MLHRATRLALALAPPEAAPLQRRPTDATARLRRKTSSTVGDARYREGQRVSIVRVPMRLAGVDVGHISLLVGNHDGTLASVGFYRQGYRRGLPMVSRDSGVLVTPDPVYSKALADPASRGQIAELRQHVVLVISQFSDEQRALYEEAELPPLGD